MYYAVIGVYVVTFLESEQAQCKRHDRIHDTEHKQQNTGEQKRRRTIVRRWQCLRDEAAQLCSYGQEIPHSKPGKRQGDHYYCKGQVIVGVLDKVEVRRLRPSPRKKQPADHESRKEIGPRCENKRICKAEVALAMQDDRGSRHEAP